MWPIKRKKKSARQDLKQVYYYKYDFIMLKAYSREQNRSMTQTAHDMIMVYIGYKEGTLMSKIEMLTIERAAAIDELRKARKELDLYKRRFGKIDQ